MNNIKYFITVLLLTSAIQGFAQRPFTAGNIVAYRVGDGTTVLSGADFYKVFIDEFTPAGTLVQTIEMPSSGAKKINNIGQLSESGLLNLSTDNKYLVVPGFNEPLGGLNDVNRSVGLVDFNGSVKSITTFPNPTFDEIRAAATDNGNNLWVTGINGVEYLPAASSTTTKISSSTGTSTGINIVNGQLYVTNTNMVPQIARVGSGVPTTSGQTLAGLQGILGSTDNYCIQFAFADLDPTIPGNDVLYLTSQSSLGSGGIKKYSLVGNTWILNGTIGTTAERYSALTIKLSGNGVTIFATRQGINSFSVKGGDIVTLTDNSGYNGALTGTPTKIISVTTTDTKCYRGLALVPQPAPFTAGNIVAYRVGDGTGSLSGGDFYKVWLDEYTTTGSLVQSIQMPSAGPNKINNIGQLPESGLLNLSVDGKYLTVPGFNEPLGGLNDVNRSVGLIDFNATVKSIASFPNPNFDEIDAAATDDGTNLWVTGTNGVEYLPFNSSTTTKLLTTQGSSKNISIVNGQLYVSNYSMVPQIATLGAGLPTTSGQTLAGLPGIISSTDNYCIQFAFADLDPTVPGNDVLYLTSQSSLGSGGIKKYSLVGNTWVSNGTIGTTAERYTGLTIKIAGNTVVLFATRQGANSFGVRGGDIVTLTDNSGYNGTLAGTPSVIVSVPVANTISFRGISRVPLNCPSVTGLQVPDIASAEANIVWAAPANGSGNYEYAITTSAVPPASGTATTLTGFNATNLSNTTRYYVHVRTKCSAVATSEWNTISFITGCSAPAVPAVNIVINATGNLTATWRKVFGANGYQYLISTNAVAPSGGTFTNDTSFTASGLSAVKQYYLHVRSMCGSGAFSSWSTKPFTTGCFVPAPTIQTIAGDGNVKWNKVANAVKYEYTFSNTLVQPVSGTFTNDTIYNASNLREGSVHYFHLRSICSTGAVSGWSTVPMYTQGLNVYPNPVRDMLNIRLNNIDAVQIRIVDMNGRIVAKPTLINGVTTINTKTWAAGIYLLRYVRGNDHYSVKIVKQ